MYWVYILWSLSAKKTYVGFTSNLEERLKSHNELATKGWTIKFRPWQLAASFPFEEKKNAMEKEKYFKTGRGRDEIKAILLAKKFA